MSNIEAKLRNSTTSVFQGLFFWERINVVRIIATLSCNVGVAFAWPDSNFKIQILAGKI